MKRALIVLSLLLGLVGIANAATRYASPPSASPTGVSPCSVSNPASARCPLQTAISAAVAGDTVLAGSGSYTGNYNINNANGTSASKILLQSEVQHGAIIQGNSVTVDSNYAFLVSRAFWIIDGFEIRNHRHALRIQSGGTDLEVRFNMIHTFTGHGALVQGHRAYIHENVIGQHFTSNSDDSWAGIYLHSTNNHTVQKNIIYAVGNNAFIQVGGFFTNGYPILGALTSNNLIQGNILMNGAKGGGIRLTTFHACASSAGPWSSNNMVRDNIIGPGQGGGISFAENVRDSTATNNLVWGNYFASIGAKGNDPGGNILTHNTVIMQNWGWMGARLETDDADPSQAPPCNHAKMGALNTTWKDNLLYSPVNAAQKLLYNSGTTYTARSHNLYWMPVTPSGNWFAGYTTVGTEVLAEPIFTNSAIGDFSLQTGSPGENAASDGSDIGIAYNEWLTQSWANKVVNLPVQEWTNPGTATSTSFTVQNGRWYQVLIYLPDSNWHTGTQVYNVNGTNNNGTLNITTNILGGCCGGWIYGTPSRYFFVGTWPATTQNFTVAWQNANAAGKVLIRQMPSPSDAFAWITDTEPDPPPVLPPEEVRVTQGSDDAREASGTVTLTDPTISITDTQLVGLRFDETPPIPQGTTITTAKIQFTPASASPSTGTPTITFKVEDSLDPNTYNTGAAAPVAVGNWPLATDADDDSGNAQHGTVTGATFAAGAMTLDGVDDKVSIASTATLQPASITMEAWIKPNGVQPQWAAVLMKPYNGLASPIFTSLGLQLNPAGAGSTIIACVTGHSGSFDQLNTPLNAIPSGVWTHVACTYSPTNGKTIYINHAPCAGCTKASAGAINYGTTGDRNLYFGAAISQDFYKGDLKGVKIYNAALTADQIVNLTQGTGITGRAVTATTPVTWAASTWVADTADAASLSPDLKTLLQPLVDNAAWVPNQPVNFIISSTAGSRVFKTFESGAAFAPILHVEYSTATLPGDISMPVWRWHRADHPEGEKWLEGCDENVGCKIPSPSKLRLRTGIRKTVDQATNQQFALYCCPSDQEDCVEDADWTQVTADCTSLGICYALDSSIIADSLTTNQLSLGGLTFGSGGIFLVDPGIVKPPISIAADTQIENEHSLQIAAGLTPGTSMQCHERYKDGTTLTSESNAVVTIRRSRGYK